MRERTQFFRDGRTHPIFVSLNLMLCWQKVLEASLSLEPLMEPEKDDHTTPGMMPRNNSMGWWRPTTAHTPQFPGIRLHHQWAAGMPVDLSSRNVEDELRTWCASLMHEFKFAYRVGPRDASLEDSTASLTRRLHQIARDAFMPTGPDDWSPLTPVF